MAGGLLRLEGLIMSGRWKNIRRLSKTRRLAKLRMFGKIRISVADLDCFDMDRIRFSLMQVRNRLVLNEVKSWVICILPVSHRCWFCLVFSYQLK
jgi:hypothetical protein